MNQNLRVAIDHLVEGVQVIAFDWRYLYINHTAARHRRRAASELIGQRMQDCCLGIAETELFSTLEDVMQHREPRILRHRFDYPAGEFAWFDLRIEPVPTGICVLSIDVTADQERQGRLQEVERQLLQAQKMEALGRLAGGIAHDFNNQLTVILGLTEMLLEADHAGDHQRDLREIAAAADRSAELTKQLLAFGRRQVFRLEPVYLPDVVRKVTRLLQRILGEDIRCELELDPQTELLLGDVGQLEHVLTNLAVNARDAMPAGGQLVIGTSVVEFTAQDITQHPAMKPGRYTALSVSDTGHGMEESTRLRVFDPFFTTKEPGKGTGLGLSTVYGIVKQMNGFIWVYSEVDRGTTFRLYFPVTTVAPRADEKAAPRVQPPGGHAHVLVVEDDAGVRELVTRTLERKGYLVTAASSAEQARDTLSQPGASFDLFLLDVVLPGDSGPTLLDHLENREVPVVFMSGYSEAHVQNRGRLDEFPLLQKPFSSAQLLAAVQQVLLGRRSDHDRGRSAEG